VPNFKFGQQTVGNVFSLQDRSIGGGARRNRTNVTAGYTSPGASTPNAMNSVPMGSSGYQVNRFNPAYDRLEEGSVIEDWIPRDLPGINKMLRILYTRDSIAGPAVDIMANLPWSEYDLQGIEDPAIMRFFEEASQLFGDKAQEMPAITVEYLVLGRFCASLIYNESKGYWDDFVPHDSDFLTITPIPVRNFDPKIDLVLSPGVRQFVNSLDYRDVAASGHLPKHLLDKMRSGQPIPLDPLNTLYLRRKSSPYDHVGTSIYTRLIPYWAMEKSLMNATVTASRRRAGNILHVKAGLDDRWEPTQQEMEDLAGLFIQADEDPVGAVVVTRTGVEGTEIRQGGQIWKWSDEWATFSEGKMRGLGISEALLSGDSCLVGRTLIQTEKGLLRIDEMGDKHGGQWQDLAVSVGSRHGTAKAVKWLYNGRKPTYRIQTELGNDIQCTGNHPLLVLNGDHTEWKRADEIELGDILCISTTPVLRKDRLVLNLMDPVPAKKGRRTFATKPREMTNDLAFLLGLILSEGCIHIRQNVVQVRFSNTDMKLIDRYVQLITKIFSLPSSIRKVYDPEDPVDPAKPPRQIIGKKKSYEAITCSKTLVEWLLALGMKKSEGRSGARFKEVPWAILQADADSQLSFLAGFIEGDGSSTGDRIILCTASSLMRHQLQVLLLSHGIIAKKYDDVVELRNFDSYLLWKKILPYMMVRIFIPKTKYKSRNSYGFSADPWRQLVRSRFLGSCNKGGVYRTDDGESIILKRVSVRFNSDQKILFDTYDRGGYDHMLNCLEKISKPSHDSLRNLISTRYAFMKVTGIEPAGDEDVYDISMEAGTEPAFVADGFVVHNTYNNAENARSVFTEQIRTLRALLTQQVYYRRFKVLARAHGFRKRKKADLDHRVRTDEPKQNNPDLAKDPPQVKIQNYDDINIKNLSQDEALDIPEGDLIVPTMHWRKSLLPEGDKEYLDLLNQLKEQGVPIPLKIWAARGGYDMDEALKMLDEDIEVRKKIGKWKQATEGGGEAGDPEGEADGNAGPFWDPGERFLELHRGEAKTVLQELVNVVNQPGKQEVLADTDFIQKTCYGIVKNQRKLELLNYVLMRLGVAQNLPISAETIRDIAEFLTKSERYSMRRRMQELQFLAMVARSPESKKVDIEQIAAKTLRVISSRNEPLAAKIEEVNKNPALGPSAPTFLSGVK